MPNENIFPTEELYNVRSHVAEYELPYYLCGIINMLLYIHYIPMIRK